MSNTRVVPWKNRKEFECVYKEVFGNDLRHQTHGVGRIDVWRSRALHKIPVAIESTAVMLHAMINHQRAVALGKEVQQDNEIRSSYSLALIRFVNHITEKGQKKEYAQPVHVLASEFGVPEWIVELRHNATHGKLPPLPMLTAACEWALAWLKTEFWEEQLGSMEKASGKKKRKEAKSSQVLDVRRILEDYQQQKFMELEEKKTKKNSGKFLDDLERLPIEKRDQLVSCVIEDGFLIPTKEQLEALRIDFSLLESHDGCTLPNMLVLFWKPVLRFLHRLSLTNLLLTTLASKVTRKPHLRNNMLCGWIKSIISSNEQADDKAARRSPTQLYKWSVPVIFRPILGYLMHIPCAHTFPVITMLLVMGQEKGQYTETQVSKLCSMMDSLQKTITVKQGGTKGLDNVDQAIHRVEDIVESRKRKLATSEDKIPTKRPSDEASNRCVWSGCKDNVDWSQIPIGILPGQTLNYLTLDLSAHIEETFSDCEDITPGDDDADGGMMEFEEDIYKDEPEAQKLSWTYAQMNEIKNNIHLL